MKNYDDINDFIDYSQKENWQKFVQESLVPIWKNARILRDFSEDLKELHGAPFEGLKKNEKELVLGGIVKRESGGVYKKNSLAKFYSKFFGLKLEDVQSYILSEQEKDVPVEIKIELTDTPFTKFVNSSFKLLDQALKSQKLVEYNYPDYDYDRLKSSPNKVKEIVQSFYEGVLNLSINYNYYTFFLNSINQVPKGFIDEAYPNFENVRDLLEDEFGLTLLDWNNPFDNGSESYENYQIMTFPEYSDEGNAKSFGGSLCKLNELLWEKHNQYSNLRDVLNILFNRVPELRDEYLDRVEGQITTEKHNNIYYKGITASESRGNIDESGKTLVELLDDVSPYLFLGLRKIKSSYEDRLGLRRVA